MDFTVQVPLNVVSFGQVSVALLREFYKKGLQPCIFPIGPIDLSCQNLDNDFANWLQSCLNKAPYKHKRTNPLFKLWHISDSWNSISLKQVLYTFYELDSPTEIELNIINNIDHVFLSSSESNNCFNTYGANNTSFLPLGFDSYNFQKQNKKNFFFDNRITFNLVGKLERRKHHAKVIKAWAKKYGNNKKYFLQCALWNPFFQQNELESYYKQILEGKEYFNIQFYPFFGSNSDYNQFLNSADIVIGMSGAEGWGLPEFHSVALGKHAVIQNCSSYKDWATQENAELVEPVGKVEAYDGKFFVKGQPFNQGNIYYFNDDDFILACEKAEARFVKSDTNWAGMNLQSKFTYEKTADAIIDKLKSV